MLDKETRMILFKVFNILIALEEANNDTGVDFGKGSLKYKDLIQEQGYEITSKEFRDFFIKKYNVDIE